MNRTWLLKDGGFPRFAATLTLAFTLLTLLAGSRPARAHLALVRQGLESAETAEAGDHFGRALATGDFNGDGVQDLATGSPDESNDLIGSAQQGCVVISYGSVHGLVPEGADLISVGDPPDLVIHYGAALAAGDFNNDGYDDLAVGLPDMDFLSTSAIGEVWIYHGGATGLSDPPNRVLRQSSVPGGAAEANDRFGAALATGDFNGDGRADLGVGSPGEDSGAGAITWFYGAAAGITTVGSNSEKQTGLGGSSVAGDAFGFALTTGDFDGDGFDELAAGAPHKAVGSNADCGLVYLVRGTAAGLTTTTPSLISQAGLASLGGVPQAGQHFGWSLAAGHFYDTTGPEDLAVGAPGEDLAPATNAGRVTTLDFDNPLTIFGIVPADLDFVNQVAGFPGIGAETGDALGYALAAGRFDTGAYDALAVGVPYENLTLTGEGDFLDCGMVHLYHGSSHFPNSGSIGSYTATTQNDLTVAADNLGLALAFGRFDGSGRANLAMGAPGKDYFSWSPDPAALDAGQVYVLAPWRQFSGRPHRASVALNCDAEIIYSQRMFDRVRPASTTKTMTCLLACEALDAGSAHIGDVYTVPSWVAQNVGGSQMDLVTGERITLGNLLKGMMTVSGNDAAYAIADLLHGGNNPWGGNYVSTLVPFQDEMNAKAASLGMTRTTLTNPPGLDEGSHYTTARDFAALTYAAMQNGRVRQIVGQEAWLLAHDIPISTLDGWLVLSPGPGQTHQTVVEYFYNGFLSNIRSYTPSALGVKGGYTGGGRITAVYAADAVEGEVFATMFGLRNVEKGDVVTDCLGCTGSSLLELGRADCQEDDLVFPPPPPPHDYGSFTSLPACPDSVRRLTLHDVTPAPGDALIEVYRQTHVAAGVPVRLAVVRSSEAILAPGALNNYGITGALAHQGARIVNRGAATANFVVTLSHPAATFNYALAPSAEVILPPFPGPPAAAYTMSIQSSSAATITLEVNERGYRFETTLADAPNNLPSFTTTLRRDGDFSDEMMGVYLVGTQNHCDEELGLRVRPPGTTSGAIETAPPPPETASPLALRPPQPNPFSTGTALSFALAQPGPVSIEAYDLQGRLVRRLLADAPRAAGEHRELWDGRDDRGRAVPSGIYLVRVRTREASRTERVVRLR